MTKISARKVGSTDLRWSKFVGTGKERNAFFPVSFPFPFFPVPFRAHLYIWPCIWGKNPERRHSSCLCCGRWMASTYLFLLSCRCSLACKSVEVYARKKSSWSVNSRSLLGRPTKHSTRHNANPVAPHVPLHKNVYQTRKTKEKTYKGNVGVHQGRATCLLVCRLA